MAKDPMDTSSVRVEVDQSTGGMTRPGDLPDPGPAASGPSGASAAVAILAAFGAIALVVVLLRPDAGNSAVGEPVGALVPPTITLVEPERSRPTSTSAPSSMINPLDGLERFPLGGEFLREATRTGDSWVALMDSQFGPTLVRSTDGLDWSPVSRRQLAGRMIGFGLVNDQLHVAVSTSMARRPVASTQSEIQIWLLDDQAEWQRVPEYGTYRSLGRAVGVEFSDDAIVVVFSAQDGVAEPPPLVVGLLDGVLAPDLATRVCSVIQVGVAAEQGLGRTNERVFLDCDREVVASVPESEFVGVVGSSIIRCLDNLNVSALARTSFDVIRFSVDEEPSLVEVDRDVFPSAIIPTDDGFLAVLASRLQFFPSCVELGPSGLPPSAHRWSPADGLVDLDVELPPAAPEVSSPAIPGVSARARPDGSIVIITRFAAYETTSDFDGFELLVESPLPSGVLLEVRGTERFVVQSVGRLAVSNDAGDWNEIDFGPNFEGFFVLATDEYAVVLLSEGPVAELVKIPFDAAPG